MTFEMTESLGRAPILIVGGFNLNLEGTKFHTSCSGQDGKIPIIVWDIPAKDQPEQDQTLTMHWATVT